MRTRAARFLFGAGNISQLPDVAQPTVAFVGRSNVGKSSLLNRLVGQRKLARVSKRPGRTQQINFFLVDDRVVFADLPGYGFARVPKTVQGQWKVLVEAYLSGATRPRMVIVLVDLRRGLLDDDARLLAYLEALGLPTAVVGTKVDKLNRDQRKRAIDSLRRATSIPRAVISFSAVTGEGVVDVWEEIHRACDTPAASRRATPGR